MTEDEEGEQMDYVGGDIAAKHHRPKYRQASGAPLTPHDTNFIFPTLGCPNVVGTLFPGVVLNPFNVV